MLKCLRKDVKLPENGRKNIFGKKQTGKKVPLMFLDVKVLREKKTLPSLDFFNKQGRHGVFIQRLKTSKQAVKKIACSQKAKSKERIILFEFKMQHEKG